MGILYPPGCELGGKHTPIFRNPRCGMVGVLMGRV